MRTYKAWTRRGVREFAREHGLSNWKVEWVRPSTVQFQLWVETRVLVVNAHSDGRWVHRVWSRERLERAIIKREEGLSNVR